MSMKKKFLAMAVIAGLVSSVSCGTESESSSSAEPSSVAETAAEVTEAETVEETTVEETAVEETEPETIEETVPEAEEETSAESEADGEETGEILTNAELLSLINNLFGMTSDGTFENDLQVAKDWDIVDTDAEIDPDAEITAEFLVSASMRATGMVGGSDSADDIIKCAVEKGVIDSTDLSAIDLSKAVDIVEKAQEAWTNQEFDSEINVELADGVIDLTDKMSVSDFEIDGDTIKLPAEFAEEIKEGSVFILPDDSSEISDGKAYVADSITDNGDGTITISGSPADFTQVYGSIG